MHLFASARGLGCGRVQEESVERGTVKPGQYGIKIRQLHSDIDMTQSVLIRFDCMGEIGYI